MKFLQATFNDGDNRVSASALSHDGSMVAFSDQRGVAIRTLATKADRLLTALPGMTVTRISWDPADTAVLVSGVLEGDENQVWLEALDAEPPRLLLSDAAEASLSSDGKELAFTRDSGVWVSGAKGEEPRKLLGGVEGDTFPLLQWTPQGHRLIYQKRRKNAVVPNAHGPLEELASQYSWEYGSVDSVSGKLLAKEANEGFQSAFLLPDGRIFYAENSFSEGRPHAHLWMVRTDPANGRFLAAPQPVFMFSGDHVLDLSVSDSGTQVGAVIERHAPDMYVGDVHFPGPSLTTIRRLKHPSTDNYPHAWTPAGDGVLFESNDLGNYSIYRQRVNDSAAELLARAPEDGVLPDFTPDGKWVLFENFVNIPGPHVEAIFRLPFDGGRPVQVPIHGPIDEFHCPLARKGTCVVRQTIGKEMVYFALDPVLGQGKELGRTSWIENVIGDWSVSPDGTTIAMPLHDPADPAIRLVKLANPGPSSIVDLPVRGFGTLLETTWAPDARGFYVESKTETGYVLLYVDRIGHGKILRETSAPIWGVPSRDGTRLAFVDQTANSNVWLGHFAAQ